MRGIREHMREVGIVNNRIETARANRIEKKNKEEAYIF